MVHNGVPAQLRDAVRDRFHESFTPQALMRPTDADRSRGAEIIYGLVEDWQRRVAEQGREALPAPDRVAHHLLDDLLGMGRLQPLLDDPEVEEIMVNGCKLVFSIRNGVKRFHDDLQMADDAELQSLLDRILAPTGRRVDNASPMVDARLPDGSRLNAVIHPVGEAVYVTIRKFLMHGRTLDDLTRAGSLTPAANAFLSACCRAGLNILVSGGTGAGKTTFLNALALVSDDFEQRTIVVEETAELDLHRRLPDCVSLEARPANAEGAGLITLRDLVRNALRMRPTRIVVGEVRGGEALDMLSAANTGHVTIATVHANNARGALSKLHTYASMTDERMPASAINAAIAEGIQIVVHLRQDHASGRRIVETVFEVTEYERSGEAGAVAGHELFAAGPGGLARTGVPCARAALLASHGWSEQ